MLTRSHALRRLLLSSRRPPDALSLRAAAASSAPAASVHNSSYNARHFQTHQNQAAAAHSAPGSARVGDTTAVAAVAATAAALTLGYESYSAQAEGQSLEGARENEWDDFMFRSIKPGEDDDEDEEDEDDEDDEEDEEEEEGSGGSEEDEGDEEGSGGDDDAGETIAPVGGISYEILARQDATTSSALIDSYSASSDFAALSAKEGSGILARDREDGEKLQVGIDYAKEKGVIDPDFVPETYIEIDVLGKTPEEVADVILRRMKGDEGSGESVIVICGLSGTGKGTTVSKLREKLESDGGEVVCWSNGNVFRSVTLLAATWCEQQDGLGGFDKDKALTKENLETFMGMLEFGKFNGKFDTRINGLGLDLLVSEVQNTELKVPKVSRNIPTVAQVTQGEVILFAADAIRKMGEDGIVVLLEGREQTVNYVRTPLRFTLVLSDDTLIGKRRAAQRLGAAALGIVKEGASDEEVKAALDGELKKMVEEA